jgi:hypothetical protein
MKNICATEECRYINYNVTTSNCFLQDVPSSEMSKITSVALCKEQILNWLMFSFCYLNKNIWLFRSTFCCLCATLVNILLSSLYCHYMFRCSWPSSVVQVVVMKDSAAHCNTVLLILYNFLRLILGYVG